MWRPANDSFSPIEVFPLASVFGAANVQPFVSPADDDCSLPSTSKVDSPVPTNADQQKQVSDCIGSKQRQLCVKRKVRYNADHNRKVKSVRPEPVPLIANTSPVDCVSLPDIVLNIDETERFDSSSEDEVEVIDQVTSDSDSVIRQYVLSPVYRLNATSDVSTERLSPLLSPSSTAGSGSISSFCTPFNPLFISRFRSFHDVKRQIQMQIKAQSFQAKKFAFSVASKFCAKILAGFAI